MPGKYKAVVVDDHDAVREFIVEALRARNFDVRGYGEAESFRTDPSRVSGIDLSRRFIDALTLVLGRIQNHLSSRKSAETEGRVSSSVGSSTPGKIA